MRFSLVSINTWKCDGNYSERIPLLAKDLNKLSPNIVLGQEVFHCVDNTISTKNYFEEILNTTSYFFASRKKNRFLNKVRLQSYSGLCLFTSLEVIFYQELYLPTNKLDGERTAQLAVINYKNYKVAIVNTHLTHLKGETSLRIKQLKYILDNININDYDAFFLCGDFNDIPTSQTIEFLMNVPNQFNNTFATNIPTHISNRCLDYICFKSKHTIDIIEQNVIQHRSKNEILISDHFPLYASYKINKNE